MARGRPQPHTQGNPCGVCGGWATLPKGRGRRCAGMTGDFVIWCTREEYAGSCLLDLNTSPPAFRHNRFGSCACGHEHGSGTGGAAYGDRAFHMDAVDEMFASGPRLVLPEPPRLEPATQDEIFQFLLGQLSLRADALADLTR